MKLYTLMDENGTFYYSSEPGLLGATADKKYSVASIAGAQIGGLQKVNM